MITGGLWGLIIIIAPHIGRENLWGQDASEKGSSTNPAIHAGSLACRRRLLVCASVPSPLVLVRANNTIDDNNNDTVPRSLPFSA
jgi:hypothetical protein